MKLLAIALPILLTACSGQGKLVEAPEAVRLAALKYAAIYAELGATYEWGAQDPLPKRLAVDCSGLVVRCYGYACGDYGCSLPFEDSTAAGMQSYCVAVDPEPGDLIFMGDDGIVSHIAIFARREGENTWFIDSTLKEDIGLDGVSERSYPTADPRLIAYGRLLVLR